MSKETGGAAFPNKSVYGRCEACGWDENSSVLGMTLRDYFAAKAMQGLWAGADEGFCTYEKMAQSAYDQADAMIARRE